MYPDRSHLTLHKLPAELGFMQPVSAEAADDQPLLMCKCVKARWDRAPVSRSDRRCATE